MGFGLGSLFKVHSNEPGSILLQSWSYKVKLPTKFANLSMLFIFELICFPCYPAREYITSTNIPFVINYASNLKVGASYTEYIGDTFFHHGILSHTIKRHSYRLELQLKRVIYIEDCDSSFCTKSWRCHTWIDIVLIHWILLKIITWCIHRNWFRFSFCHINAAVFVTKLGALPLAISYWICFYFHIVEYEFYSTQDVPMWAFH